METNDQHLCVVPASTRQHREKIWLAFEGNFNLSLMLSKAFLRADDSAITNPVSLKQIK